MALFVSHSYGYLEIIEGTKLPLLPDLVEKSSNVSTVSLRKLSSIDKSIGINICKFDNLFEIYISENVLRVLPSCILLNCQNLTYLYIINNNITQIKYDAFNGLSGLRWLDLSNNQLKTLHKDTFKPLINLTSLNLRNNQLQTIHADLFYHNSRIQSLYLCNNDLRHIQRSCRMFKEIENLFIIGNPNLTSIDFPHMGNVYASNCSLKRIFIRKNLKSIVAKNNKISSIEIHPKSKLEYLSVKHDNLLGIANISHLKSLGKLKCLDISCNGIDDIDFSEVYCLKNLTTLMLDYIPERGIRIGEMKENLPMLKFITFYHHDLTFRFLLWISHKKFQIIECFDIINNLQ